MVGTSTVNAVAKNKPEKKARIELQAPMSWAERAQRIAQRAGFSTLAAYIRATVTEDMDRREAKWRLGQPPADAD